MDDDHGPGKDIVPAGSTWPDVIRELAGKIPEAYQKSLLKAGIRLIHSATIVGTTWLDTQAKDLESKQKARAAMREALVKAAAKEIKDRPDIVDRAVDHFVDDIIVKQENREAVVKKSIGFLTEGDTPSPSSSADALGEIDEDWLDGLSRHAENASSDRMRTLFGKILAGEIRSPGSYSLFTLDHLAKLRKEDTELIVRIAPFVFADMVVKVQRANAVFTYDLSLQLAELGILNPISIGAMTTTRTFSLKNGEAFKNRFSVVQVADDLVYVYCSDKEKDVTLPCSILTKVGQEILTLVSRTLDAQMLEQVAEALKAQEADLFLGKVVSHVEGRVTWKDMVQIRPTPATSSPPA